MTEFCSNCGDLCCGKLMIKIYSRKYYPFCSGCFNLFQYLDSSLLKTIFRTNENFVIME